MKSDIITRQRQQIAILRKLASDKLGQGMWGLMKEPSARFTHEEVVFMFARIFAALGFDAIKEIRTSYPDCKAIRGEEVKYIEFEPYLSDFRSHLGKDDLGICDYVVCWDDDLQPYDDLRDTLHEKEIEVIKLKEMYEKTKVTRKKSTSYVWRKEDIERLTENQLKMLAAFIQAEERFLNRKQLGKNTGIKGRALGGSLKGFTEHRKTRDWLLRNTAKGWEFNKKYKDIVEKVLYELGILKLFPMNSYHG